MLYFLLIIPGLIIAYLLYFKHMISKAANTGLYHPSVPADRSGMTVKDFSYKEEGKFPWKGRFYAPDDGQARPCIVLYHGELPDFIDPKPVDWQIFDDYGRLLAQKGFAAVIFNHRSSKNTKDATPAREDLLDLISYIRSDASLFPIQKDKMGLWAFSGGPYICLNWIIREKPDYIKAMVSYYGVLNGKERGESAVELIKTDRGDRLPPILMATAEKDRIRSSIKDAEEFYAAAKEKTEVLLLKHPGPHGFDVLSRTDETVDILDKTFDFIETKIL